MSDTALGEALQKAGIKPAQDRLNEIALSAMVAHADDTNAAIEQVWEKIQKDAGLLIALFNRYGQYRTEISRVFHQLKHDIAVQQQSGAKLGPRERKALAIIKHEREEERREEAEQRAIDRAEQTRRDQEYKDYLASWHKTPLWNVAVGDKPVWEVSAGTVRAWLPTQHKKLRAIEMLIQGIPEDSRPISYYRTAADMMEIWKIIGGDDDER